MTGLPAIPVPSLTYVFTARVEVAAITATQGGPNGVRRIIPILGGTVEGPRLSAKIIPGGTDVQAIGEGGFTTLQARYLIEADDGTRIFVENNGIRHAPPEIMADLTAGKIVDPTKIYFRASPRFEAPAGPHDWLNRTLFVCSGARMPDSVHLAFYAIG